METAELKILNVLFEKLHLTDEEKIDFTENFEKARENGLKSTMEEFKSLFREEFHRLEIRLEQFDRKLDKHKSDIDSELKQNKSDIDLKFEQFDRKLDKHKSDIDLRFEEFNRKFEEFSRKLEQNKSDIDLKLKDIELKLKDIELRLKDINSDLELKIEKSNTISIRWFISLFVAVVLLILGLYFKH